MAPRRRPRPAPGPRPREIRLTKAKRRKLEEMARSYHCKGLEVLRAKAILGLAEDPCLSRVAQQLGVHRKSVTRWRDRFRAKGVEGLKDAPRPGRSPVIDAVTRCELIAMACAKPSDFGVPHRQRWTYDVLHKAFLEQHPEAYPVSRTSVIRILNAKGLRPHRIYYWLHSRDPLFREKVTEICGLYLRPPLGAAVLCVDEKPGIQALARKSPTKVPTVDHAGRFEHEYIRNGTRKLIAAIDVRSGEVYGEVRPTRTAQDLVEFMEELAQRYPNGDVHIIWDNLNIHFDGKDKRWTKFNERHDGRFHFHYTPLHASWVNQIECWFSVLQRRVIRHNSFESLEALDEALLAFIDYWNRHEKKPFRWTFKGYPPQMEKAAA